MDDLASIKSLEEFRERIRQSAASKIMGKLLSVEARRHFKHGYKTGCTCDVCNRRRDYVIAQERPFNHEQSYRTMSGGWWDSRYDRKERMKAFKKQVLGE